MTVAANKGYHPLLETDHPYVFVDSCMQIWPDADFANAHRHGVTAYAVTAWRPHATVEQALEEGYSGTSSPAGTPTSSSPRPPPTSAAPSASAKPR